MKKLFNFEKENGCYESNLEYDTPMDTMVISINEMTGCHSERRRGELAALLPRGATEGQVRKLGEKVGAWTMAVSKRQRSTK